MPVKDEWPPRPPVARREGPTEPGLQVNWHFLRASISIGRVVAQVIGGPLEAVSLVERLLRVENWI